MAEPVTVDAIYAAVARRIGPAWSSRTVTAGTRAVPAERVTDRGWLSGQILGSARRWGSSDLHVLGVLWWYGASTVITGPALTALAVTGIGLSSAPEDVVLHMAPDGRLLGAHSTALGGTGAEVVGANLGANLGGIVDAIATLGVRPAPLWAIATDAIANQLLWLGQAAGEVERISGLAAPVVAALRGARASSDGVAPPEPRYVDLPGPRGPRRFVRRASCCLIYRLPDGAMCTSCPRRPDAERTALLARLATRG